MYTDKVGQQIGREERETHTYSIYRLRRWKEMDKRGSDRNKTRKKGNERGKVSTAEKELPTTMNSTSAEES